MAFVLLCWGVENAMTTTTSPVTSPSTEPTHAQREALAQRFLRLRDELIVRNHLAGMEAKSAVHELAREMEKLASSFSRSFDMAVEEVPNDLRLRWYMALLDSNTRFLEMEAAVKSALAGAAHSATVVAEVARVKAALARMDAHSAMETRRAALKKELHDVEARSAKVLKDIEARLTRLGIETSKIV